MSTVEKVVEDILKRRGSKDLSNDQLQLRTHRIGSHFVRRGTTLTSTSEIWDEVNSTMTRDRLPGINFKPEYMKAYAEGTINLVDSIVVQRYHNEVANTYFVEFKKLLDSPFNNRYTFVREPTDYLGFTIKKADDDGSNIMSVRIMFIKDSKGWITGFEILNPMGDVSPIIQKPSDSETKTVENLLTHHGVKGMKWGVRRNRSSNVTVSDKKKKLKTSGGHGRPAHSDAVSARTLGQVGKKSGLKALSNQELQAYANRLQLEQNVSRLNYNEKSAPRRFVSSLLGRQGSQLANDAAKTGATKAGRGALNKATRKSIRVARTAAAVSAL